MRGMATLKPVTDLTLLPELLTVHELMNLLMLPLKTVGAVPKGHGMVDIIVSVMSRIHERYDIGVLFSVVSLVR